MIIRIPGLWPFGFSHSRGAHWHQNGNHHGHNGTPINPALFKLTLVDCLGPNNYMNQGRRVSESSVWRLWVYVRGGFAWRLDLNIDRRRT